MVTIKKDLRSGQSVWMAYSRPKIPHENLKSDMRTDVLVIGAGITGALMAEELTDAGFSVIILDRRVPLTGSTLATTALLQSEIDEPLTKLSRQIGFDKAARAWRRSKLGLDSLAEKTQLLGISYDLRPELSLYTAGNVLDPDALKKEQDALRQIGFTSDFLDHKQLTKRYSINARVALLSSGNYSANPYKLAHGYLKISKERGTKIFAPEEISDIESSARRVYAHTKSGFCASARYVVFTTGYEVPEQLKKQNYKIFSTWAMATKKDVADDIPMLWEASDPYLYIRRAKDGRIICGGEDEEFSNEKKRDAMTSKKVKALQRKMKKLLPIIDNTPEYGWCGSFGVTPTGLPLIGPVPGLKNCFAVLAFGGNGIVNGRIGADIIRNYLTGKDDPDADIYNFKLPS
ncbi:MAG TPA: FAD-binding oxidoreductase [Alphaproteobacteria bacterium]|nr:FAD-binding oxidoreductase [Micavibrio sp.]MBK9561942.1 FAD-binding oxidoreductase [Micavibrio sp.]HQX28105.1 FAD-binding oxidoreductase [Alphaproteobacteria bacterium]